ncbi:F-box only protein 15, partial [Austrofundulus limnaeus]
RKKRVEQSSVHWTESYKPRNAKVCFPFRTLPASTENFIERLPSEILIKILSYLDVSSLFCVSHVSRLLHQLSNDNILWQKIYEAEFGSHTWKPSSAEEEEETAEEEQKQEEEECMVSRWKKMYFNTVARQEIKKWRRDLKDVNPYTGLPNQTEWVLRNMNVSWELTVSSCTGWETTEEQSRAHFFETSVILSWSQGFIVKYRHLS